jgi:hypothetical protein
MCIIRSWSRCCSVSFSGSWSESRSWGGSGFCSWSWSG